MRVFACVVAAALSFLSGCACGHRSPAPAAAEGAYTEVSTGPALADIDAVATDGLAHLTQATGFGLLVLDRDGTIVFQKMYGDFHPDRPVAVASASKLVSGIVLFDVIHDGLLSLDSDVVDVLGFPADKRGITLRHLLSFTSGLPAHAACTNNPAITLAACVDKIGQLEKVAAPGAQFEYGSTHLAVAARMAEVVTGKTWNRLFVERVRQPLGIVDEQVKYYTGPRRAFGISNPLVAGGLVISMRDYARILQAALHDGALDDSGGAIGSAAEYRAQVSEPFPVAQIVGSPMAAAGYPFHYGLAGWLECPPPARDCSVVSSAGAFGFMPWIDRATGYVAVLGMQGTFSLGEERIGHFSMALEQRLRGPIEAAVRARRGN